MDPKIPRQRWRHLGLLILLLLLFIVAPIVGPLRYGVLFLNVVAAAILLLGTHVVSERKRIFTATLVLAIATIVARLVGLHIVHSNSTQAEK